VNPWSSETTRSQAGLSCV